MSVKLLPTLKNCCSYPIVMNNKEIKELWYNKGTYWDKFGKNVTKHVSRYLVYQSPQTQI